MPCVAVNTILYMVSNFFFLNGRETQGKLSPAGALPKCMQQPEPGIQPT